MQFMSFASIMKLFKFEPDGCMPSSYFFLFVWTRGWAEESPTTHNRVGWKITKKKNKKKTKKQKQAVLCRAKRRTNYHCFLYIIILYQNHRKMVKTKIKIKQQIYDTCKAIGSKVKSHESPTVSSKASSMPFNCEAYSSKNCPYFFNCASPTIPRGHKEFISGGNVLL